LACRVPTSALFASALFASALFASALFASALLKGRSQQIIVGILDDLWVKQAKNP
jgi:hypothetical protein